MNETTTTTTKTVKRQNYLEKRKVKMENALQNDELNFPKNGVRVGAKEDPFEIQVPGQLWYCISFIAPIGASQRSKKTNIKIRGGFSTDTEAHAHADQIYKVDPDIDIHVVKGYNWIQIPPPLEHYDSIPMKYQQKEIGPIMDNYYMQQRKAAIELDTRMKNAKQQVTKKNKAKVARDARV